MNEDLNRIAPQATIINIGGQDRELWYGMKFFRELSRKYGNLQAGLNAISSISDNGIDVEMLVDLIYQGLFIDQTIKREMVSEWLDNEVKTMNDLMKLVNLIPQAIIQSSPVASGDPTNPAKK